MNTKEPYRDAFDELKRLEVEVALEVTGTVHLTHGGSRIESFRCSSLDRGDLPREKTTADRSGVHILELTSNVRERVVDDQSDTIPTTAGHYALYILGVPVSEERTIS